MSYLRGDERGPGLSLVTDKLQLWSRGNGCNCADQGKPSTTSTDMAVLRAKLLVHMKVAKPGWSPTSGYGNANVVIV